MSILRGPFLLELAIALYIASKLIEHLVPYLQRIIRNRTRRQEDIPPYWFEVLDESGPERPALGPGAAWSRDERAAGPDRTE